EELKTLNLEANPKNIADAVINIRNRKLPSPSKIGNSGSFFKNPIISTERFEELQKEFPNIVGYKMGDTETKVAAGWLIDNAGLKGYRKGDAGVHKNQALVLVNYNNASGQDIINLSELVQEVILEKYGISIEAEVNFI
ncbi:UDP-N-acetylenolpyruvoylglucosamine reductase, partial [Flavobacteriales bacterium]|nr:UDP-N-acetylenolpyruvoylglucosamine reductase [Flavobacteriales bacterium]